MFIGSGSSVSIIGQATQKKVVLYSPQSDRYECNVGCYTNRGVTYFTRIERWTVANRTTTNNLKTSRLSLPPLTHSSLPPSDRSIHNDICYKRCQPGPWPRAPLLLLVRRSSFLVIGSYRCRPSHVTRIKWLGQLDTLLVSISVVSSRSGEVALQVCLIEVAQQRRHGTARNGIDYWSSYWTSADCGLILMSLCMQYCDSLYRCHGDVITQVPRVPIGHSSTRLYIYIYIWVNVQLS